MSSQTVYTKLRKIELQACDYPDRVFTTLAHLIDVDFLREAFRRTRKSSSPGIDGVTAQQYAEHLEDNLHALHQTLKAGRYRAPPVQRVWLEKPDGGRRPIGKPAFEDKIVQRAVAMILERIYENDFHDFSYGFRRRRSPHTALSELRRQCNDINVSQIIDADVSGFFDNMVHKHLREFLGRRVNDGSLSRLIGKWLKAGVLDGEQLMHPDMGSPQGGVVSPILANLYLHYVLDEWFAHEVRPRMKGRVFLIRFADDFIIGCEREDDALRIMEVLPKRFARYGLTIHPEKSKRIAFARPRLDRFNNSRHEPSDKRQLPCRGKSTFEFLGFTHYWARSRSGYWVIKRRTASKRVRRAVMANWKWCRTNRHLPLSDQHRILSLKLRGHFQYYGVRCNLEQMHNVLHRTKRSWFYWLNKRRRSPDYNWETFNRLIAEVFPLPNPRIVHDI